MLDWMMDPTFVEKKWSIVDCEFRYASLGLQAPYTKWREGERKRWLPYSKFWRELQDVKSRYPSNLPGGGGMSDREAVRVLDRERESGKLKVSTWLDRLDKRTRSKRSKEAVAEGDVATEAASNKND